MGDFREEYRRREIGPRYSGWGHFAFTTLTCAGVIAFAIARVHSPSWAELSTVPLAFLFSNLAEYLGHKGAMHVPRPGLRLVYERHTLFHHHFFTHETMACASSRDFQIMLFPPVLVLFFFGAIAAPIGALLFLLISSNVGWLFVATAVGYFLTYEWLHFSYHLDPDSFAGRLGVVRILRRHHAAHHDLAKMGRYNFNITFPLCDVLFRTRFREGDVIQRRK